MARVVTTEVDGFRTCARPRIVDSASWGDDTVLLEDCPGYDSEPCRLVREEVVFTFADCGAQATPGFDIGQVERSTVRYLPADGDWSCPHCGFETSAFSLEPRTKYMQRSEQHPDELRRRSLRQDKREVEQLTLAERQAAALEQANELKRRELDLRERELAVPRAPKAEAPAA